MKSQPRTDQDVHVFLDTAHEPSGAPSRRTFLIGVALTGTGLVLAKQSLFAHEQNESAQAVPLAAGLVAGSPFSAYLEITTGNEVRIVSPQTEIGQGVFDTLAMIVADELDADWSRVVVRLPHANKAFANPVNKRQRIGGSDSVMAYREPLRQVGAAAREMLVTTAAARWKVPVESCSTRDSRVLHGASGRSLTFGGLAIEAAALPVPRQPKLKSASELRLTGQRLMRKDTPSKIDGSALYAVDIREPGMVFAALRRSNSLAGRLRRFDASAVQGRRGVVAIVPLEDAVAVVAESWWIARQAAEALEVEFDESAMDEVSSESLRGALLRTLDDDAAALEQALAVPGSAPPRRELADRAAVAAALARQDATQLELTYEVPYLAHMTMEPQSCVAKVTADSCLVLGGLQQPDFALDLAARLTGLPPERVRVDVVFGGGGFGRRWELDSVRQAVSIAKQVPGRAVNLIWTREQDMQHDFYRPAHVARYRASIDAAGNVLAVQGRTAGQSLLGYKGMRRDKTQPDASSSFGIIPQEYDLPNRLCEWVELPAQVPVGFWRAVGASQNGFFAESLMDELAYAAKRDPLEFRRGLIRSNTRARAVLERLAIESEWSKPLATGRGRGIALSTGFGSICGQVFEVSVVDSTVTIERVTCVYDCGPILNPSTVEAQLEGGIVYGLCAALNGEITLQGGKVEQGNFHDQPMLRLSETPPMKIVLMDSQHRIGGVGEGGVPPVAAALTNAIFAATGRRYRTLPLRKAGLEFVGLRA